MQPRSRGNMRTSVKYLLTGIIGLALAVVIADYRGLFAAETTAQAMLALSDGCLFPGILFTAFGLLSMISSTGFFDITKYGMGQLLSLFRKDTVKQDKDYYEYVQRKKEERKRRGSIAWLLVCGIIFLLLSALFTVLFYQF